MFTGAGCEQNAENLSLCLRVSAWGAGPAPIQGFGHGLMQC